eukprot:COSAG01_NODE_28908_length_649_cov_15.043636_1_plen_84_part_01
MLLVRSDPGTPFQICHTSALSGATFWLAKLASIGVGNVFIIRVEQSKKSILYVANSFASHVRAGRAPQFRGRRSCQRPHHVVQP